MCGKELSVNQIMLTEMLVIAETKTLSDNGIIIDEKAMLSSISVDSGAYYNVFVQILYKDGSKSELMDCSLDKNNSIMAWFPESIDVNKVKAIKIGAHTFSIK